MRRTIKLETGLDYNVLLLRVQRLKAGDHDVNSFMMKLKQTEELIKKAVFTRNTVDD